ncbi:MAG: hypothetical protein IK012_01185 [Fibrobacter sp.]|uniref:hypothetical protein n=1 Tax=Fibrobacter sp. TaxID=35828 RepID=UPI0025B7D481|nr:hypothetical protein [Fibrobacter sp.]MBR4783854.1 hypothetical protein [Fibrobacter sp.]
MKRLALSFIAAFLLASCAQHEEPEVDFKPIQLNWSAQSGQAESHPDKDRCVISITSALMQDKRILASKMELLDYLVLYDVKGENLEFKGICGNVAFKDAAECHWTAVCAAGENVVVKFHNGD